MKLLRRLLLCLGLASTSTALAEGSLYDLSVKNIDGDDVSLSTYRGSVALVVNTASQCGFTNQYEALEKLYLTYKDRGFIILGFPSNDFMGQEPGSNAEIKKFCTLNYDVTFPLFSKGSVTGEGKQPVYKFLTEDSGENLRGSVRWNFEKFLVDRKGMVIERFRTFTSPNSNKITKAIENALLRADLTEESPSELAQQR